jgi:hypothetical protein
VHRRQKAEGTEGGQRAQRGQMPPKKRRLTSEQETLRDELIAMGMDASLAAEAAEMGLDEELAFEFCTDEHTGEEQRNNHSAALRAEKQREGMRSQRSNEEDESLSSRALPQQQQQYPPPPQHPPPLQQQSPQQQQLPEQQPPIDGPAQERGGIDKYTRKVGKRLVEEEPRERVSATVAALHDILGYLPSSDRAEVLRRLQAEAMSPKTAATPQHLCSHMASLFTQKTTGRNT